MAGAYECFASDRQFFVAVDDPTAPAVRLIELKNKTVVLTVSLPREMPKEAEVALSPDGKFFIVETVEPAEPSISVLDVWDLTEGRRIQRLEPRLSGVRPIIFSRDGKYFCCVSDENIVIFKMDGFQRVSEFREWSPWGARPAFAPSSDVIAVPLWQQRRVRLWDFLRNQDIAVLEEPSSVGGVRFCAGWQFPPYSWPPVREALPVRPLGRNGALVRSPWGCLRRLLQPGWLPRRFGG